MISQYFDPENFRINDLVEQVCKNGHEVTVVTSFPRYPNRSLFSEISIASIDIRWRKFGVDVIRVNVFDRDGGSFYRLALNYFSFVFGACSALVAKRIKSSEKFDLVLVYQPSPVTVLIPGALGAGLFGGKVYCWVLDVWPYAVFDLNYANFELSKKLISRFSRICYNLADKLFITTESVRPLLLELGIYRKIEVLPHFPEEIFYSRSWSNKKPNTERNLKLGVLGNLGCAQELDRVFRSICQVATKDCPISIKAYGEGRAKATLRRINPTEACSICFAPPVPIDEVLDLYDDLDAVIISLKEGSSLNATIPARLSSALVYGVPVIFWGGGESKKLVEQCGFWVVDWEDLGATQRALKQLSEMKLNGDALAVASRNARKLARDLFNREFIVQQLVKDF